MAKDRGPQRIIGRLGDRTNYEMKGVKGIITRRAAGPTKQMIETLPQFEETRKNISSFSDCSKAMKLIRQPFAEVIAKVRRPFEHSRFLKEGYKLYKSAPQNGRHPFETECVRGLVGYQFNAVTDLSKILYSSYNLEFDGNMLRVNVDGRQPKKYKRANHFALTCSVAGINFETEDWEAHHSQSDFFAFNATGTMAPYTIETKVAQDFPVLFIVLMLTQLDYTNGQYYWYFHRDYSAANIVEVIYDWNVNCEKEKVNADDDWRRWIGEG